MVIQWVPIVAIQEFGVNKYTFIIVWISNSGSGHLKVILVLHIIYISGNALKKPATSMCLNTSDKKPN